MAYIIATAQIGTRTIRCVGVSGECNKREIFGQLDLFAEHVRRETEQAERRGRLLALGERLPYSLFDV